MEGELHSTVGQHFWKFQTDKESSSNASSRNAVLAVHFICRKANLQCCAIVVGNALSTKIS